MHVSALAITPVKGTRLMSVERVRVERHGVRENRRFYLIDERDRMVNAKSLGRLQTVLSRYDDAARRLELEFPDGRIVVGSVRLGERITTRFYSRQARAHHVLGEWSEAISEYIGKPLWLVEADEDGAVDRGAPGAVSLISRASLQRLAQEGGLQELDARRFRMLIEIDGVGAHEEDAWVQRRVSAGEALIAPRGHVGRCLITSRDPDTGEVDVPTLDLLGGYRRDEPTTEPLPFGIFGEVLRAGTVAVGDPVSVSRG